MIATLERPEATETETEQLTEEFRADLAQLCKMLADSNRLRIVFFLLNQAELNVTEICERLEQSQPAVSHHLALLKQSGILKVRRDGKHNFYSVCSDRFQSVMVRLFESLLDPSVNELRIDNFLLSHAPAPVTV